MPNRWLVFLLLSCLALVANAADSPRALVAGVAVAIEDHYFDAERDHKIADGLRAGVQPEVRAASGAALDVALGLARKAASRQ